MVLYVVRPPPADPVPDLGWDPAPFIGMMALISVSACFSCSSSSQHMALGCRGSLWCSQLVASMERLTSRLEWVP